MDYCSMEEMVTLQYSSFLALIEGVKILTQKPGHSKQVTEHVLRWQLFLDELQKDQPGWIIASQQE